MANEELKQHQQDLWSSWSVSKDDTPMSSLLDSLQPLIKSRITKFVRGPIPYSVLLGQANLLARDALEKYDPEKAQLTTYLVHQLRPMERFVSQNQNIKYVPEHVSMEFGRYENTLRTLENSLGRHPTHEEIAKEMEVTQRTVSLIEKGIAPEQIASSVPGEMGDELQFSEEISSRQGDLAAYLRAELGGNQLKAFDMISGRKGKAKSPQEIAEKLKVEVGDVYNWRRQWTDRLKEVEN